MKTYKYHYLYHKSDPENIYAYTDDKKAIKLFMEQRKMEDFYYFKRETNAKAVSLLAMEIPSKQLCIKELATKDANGDLRRVSVCMTLEEFTCVNWQHHQLAYNTELLYDGDPPPRGTFLPEIEEALENLGLYYLASLKKGDILLMDDESWFVIDDLQLFLYIDHDTWVVYESMKEV